MTRRSSPSCGCGSISWKWAILLVIIVIVIGALVSSCAHKPVTKPVYSQTGKASWYGPGFHGRKTANGERYNQNAMTAAHKKLPFGTKVRVINLDNGKETVVRINDRGPFIRGRIIDLSRKAAKEIAMHRAGTARVRIETLETREASPGEPVVVTAAAEAKQSKPKKKRTFAKGYKRIPNRR